MAVAATLLGALVACRSVDDTQTTPREYAAYGEKWKYFTVEHYIRDWGFDSARRFFGLRERVEQDVYLVSESGEKIDVSRRIVGLQEDGSYKAVPCCDNMRTMADVYNFEGKLVLTFEQTRAKTTDCWVYPPNRPNDDKSPPGEAIQYAFLFGEFDPQAKVFRVREFFPGVSDNEARSALGANPSNEQIDRFFYTKRVPFVCKR